MHNQQGSAINRAAAYWEEQCAPKEKCDQSTACGTSIQPKLGLFDHILAKSAQKWQEFIFGRSDSAVMQMQEEVPPSPQLMSEELQFAFSAISQQSDIADSIQHESLEHESSPEPDSQKVNQVRSIKKQKKNIVKKRFTVLEDQLIVNQVLAGCDFNQIARMIPGSTSSQIKHHYVKKLRYTEVSEPTEIDNIIKDIQLLIADDSSDKLTKIENIKAQINSIQNLLTKTSFVIVKLQQFETLIST